VAKTLVCDRNTNVCAPESFCVLVRVRVSFAFKGGTTKSHEKEMDLFVWFRMTSWIEGPNLYSKRALCRSTLTHDLIANTSREELSLEIDECIC